MKLLPEALQLIKTYEGFSSEPYLCAGEVWTIGYGHTQGVTSYMQPISAVYAEELLRADIAEVEAQLKPLLSQALSSKQYSALVSFVFNVGIGNFKRSTLRKKLNASDVDGAAREFERWVYAGGKRLKGLEKRRKDERKLFTSPASGGGYEA